MLLFPRHPLADPFAGADPFAIDDLLSPFDLRSAPAPRYAPQRCSQGAWSAAARFHHPPTLPAYRLVRQPSFAPPAVPEVHLQRGSDGVVACCRLRRGFSRQDISLELSGRDLELTVFHPGTAHWAERPAAYRRTLELADHIDARGIRARLSDGGVLEVFCPYRRVTPPPPPPAPVQYPRLVLVQRPPVVVQRPAMVAMQRPMAAPNAPAPAPAAVRAAAVRAPAPAAPASLEPQRMAAAPSKPAPAPEAAPPAAVQRPHRRHHAQRRRRTSILQQAQPMAEARTVPVSGSETAPATKPAQPAHQQAQPSSRGPRIIPVESPRAAPSPAAAAAAADHGKRPASLSPEQAASERLERRREVAAARIAAGIASDSDWEEADGTVTDCSLEG